MTRAEEFEKSKRLIRVQRKFLYAFNQALQKFDLNLDIGTIEARDAANVLDEAMFNFAEGTKTMADVESAFKTYIRAITMPANQQ